MTRPANGDAAKLMALMDTLRGVAAGVAGYRKQLIEGGFSPDIADLAALQLHEALMAKLAAAPTPAPATQGQQLVQQLLGEAMKRGNGS